ncbi:MAG: hypothetical protein IPF98_07245 [Gemmatimonadetes bacterium]|nr:hypothetical protein [Gemmatimonadota bacterium]
MKNSKNLALMFLLGTFLTGGVLGFTANRFMHRDQVCFTESTGGSLLAIMSQRLGLSAEQQHAVDAILDDRSRQYKLVLDPIRPRTDSIKLYAREQMRQVLNDDQKREFEELIREMNDSTRKNGRE